MKNKSDGCITRYVLICSCNSRIILFTLLLLNTENDSNQKMNGGIVNVE